MSSDRPPDTFCDEVLLAVYAYLDGEMTDSDSHLIREHLDDCSPCLRQFGLEQEVKALVARCCGAEPSPADLRAKVVSRLAQVRLEITQVEFRID